MTHSMLASVGAYCLGRAILLCDYRFELAAAVDRFVAGLDPWPARITAAAVWLDQVSDALTKSRAIDRFVLRLEETAGREIPID